MKVKIFNKKLRDSFFLKISLFSAFATLLLAFVPIPSKIQGLLGGVFLVFLVIIYIYDWRKANKLNTEAEKDSYTVLHRFVFNIKENDYRLVAIVIFASKKVYIRFIGTHATYDKTNCLSI